MENKKDAILEFAQTMNRQTQAEWDHLPDIGLYMDQVVTFLERQLAPFRENEGGRIVTSSMINNYTKGGVIPKAEAKKYSQSHIALLILVCSLKQVLSIPDLTRLLSGLGNEELIEALYSSWRSGLADSLNATADLVTETIRKNPDLEESRALRKLALDFAIEAQTRSFAAKRILAILDAAPVSAIDQRGRKAHARKVRPPKDRVQKADREEKGTTETGFAHD